MFQLLELTVCPYDIKARKFSHQYFLNSFTYKNQALCCFILCEFETPVIKTKAKCMHVHLLNHVRLFGDAMDCSLPGSSLYRISQVRMLEWVAISFSRESSQPSDQTHDSWIGRQILLPLSHQWNPKTKYFLFKFFNMYVCICLCQVLVAACGVLSWGLQTLSYGMWDPIPKPGIKPSSLALGVLRFSHWTTREVLPF